jgi:hypothetical protein
MFYIFTHYLKKKKVESEKWIFKPNQAKQDQTKAKPGQTPNRQEMCRGTTAQLHNWTTHIFNERTISPP